MADASATRQRVQPACPPARAAPAIHGSAAALADGRRPIPASEAARSGHGGLETTVMVSAAANASTP